jgi:hypothetical protein
MSWQDGDGIPFSENTVGVWYVHLENSDWLASIWMEDGKATMAYRFRYYKDDKTFDSEDEKNWYGVGSTDPSPDKLVLATRMIADKMAKMAGEEVYELMMADCGSEKAFMEEFAKAPFVDMQQEVLH